MMAKRNRTQGRGISISTANRRLPPVIISLPRAPLSVSSLSPVLQLEDRRRFQFDGSVRAPAAVRRSDTRLVDRGTRVTFAVPDRVAMCVRRKVRKEVLHALNVAGRTGIKKRRTNFWSKVGC